MRPFEFVTLLSFVLIGVLAFATGASSEEPAHTGRVVATIGQDQVLSDDVVAFWFDRYREGWIRTVENLLDERIVEREGRRLGLVVPRAAVTKAVGEEVAARRRQLVDAYGEGADLAAVVEDAYSMDIERWKREVLEPRIGAQLLLQRVVRLDTRRRERVKVRVIVTTDEARAGRVVKKLKAGADFSLVALKQSIDPTAKSGGVLPLISRGDLTLPDVEAKLFASAPGSLVGPLAVTLEGATTWHVYKIIERVQPWSGDRRSLLARLEADLVENALGRGEFDRWRARVRRDFGVRVFDPRGRSVVLPSAAR